MHIDVAPVGVYSPFVVSQMTSRNYKAPITESEGRVLNTILDEAAIDVVVAPAHKLYLWQWAFPVGDVIIRSGGVTHFSYDFGHTYFRM